MFILGMLYSFPSALPPSDLEHLYLRYDGPLPADAVNGLLAGGSPLPWLRRAASRVIDRAARNLLSTIAARQLRQARVARTAQAKDAVMATLCETLRAYRDLGVALRLPHSEDQRR